MQRELGGNARIIALDILPMDPIEGVTFSNFIIADLLQNLVQSPWFGTVDLQIAEKGKIEDVQVVKFKVQTRAVRAEAPAPIGG